jgi:hypothetical protein
MANLPWGHIFLYFIPFLLTLENFGWRSEGSTGGCCDVLG